jgi:hypothetical protein
MPTPPPRHLARPRRPWRLLLFVFGLATAILAALVASATLLPQPQPPRHAPGVALPTSPTRPAPTAASTTTTGDREPTATTSPSTTPGPEQGGISGPATTARPATTPAPARVGAATGTARSSSGPTQSTQLPATAPSTTARPTTTAAAATTAAPTTSIVSTTSIPPSTRPTTTVVPTTTTAASTSTGPATTTTGPVLLAGSQPASISAATVGTLLPLLGVFYLLGGLPPQAGGRHARRRRHANHRGRFG